MSRFLEVLHSGRVLLMDGGMGTELQRAGLQAGECGELWDLTRPGQVRTIHQAYVDAGAECLLTNTFQANPWALARWQQQDQLFAVQRQALFLARAVAGSDRFVLADIGPICKPDGTEECPNRTTIRQTLEGLREADAVLFETYSSPGVRDVLRHADLERIGLPLLLSLTYQRTASGEFVTRSGHPPEWFARRAREWGVAALGVNCGRDIDMDAIIGIIRRYRQTTDLPLFARPNAGTPTRDGDRWVYPTTPEQMAARLPELLEAGACMIGGCCGTTPEYIAAFRQPIEDWNERRRSRS
jgi:5-methyltetrahydrofolate--homocysteine methyltransferase